MTHGGCIVLQESFEAGEALALIERERCSVYYGMGHMARALLEHEDHPRRRLGAMRTGLTIGPPEDIAMTIEALGAAELCNVYGSTETYGNCAVTDARTRCRCGCTAKASRFRNDDPYCGSRHEAAPARRSKLGNSLSAAMVTPGYFRHRNSMPRRSTGTVIF